MGASEPRRPALYPVLHGLGGWILRVFYRSISLRAEATVPETGPLLFAANHPNTAFDPVCVSLVTNRPVHFLGKSGLFQGRFANWFFRSMGILPVYRRQDDPAQMDRNRQTFEACYRCLGAGEALAIFPEGTSHDDPQLRQIKTGAARIALEAEAAHGFGLGVRIVPVGLTFPQRARFRSTLSIRVGASMEVAQYAERYKASPEEAVRGLTVDLEARIRDLMVHMDRLDLAERVQRVEEIYRDELREDLDPASLAAQDTVVLSKTIADAAERLTAQDPEGMGAFWGRVDAYVERLRRWRLRDEALREQRGTWSWALWLGYGLAYGAVALPIALYGVVNHYIPYYLTGLLADRPKRHVVDRGPYKVYFGLPLFLFFYAVQGWMVWRWKGTVFAAIYVGTLPLFGLWALAFIRRARAFWARVRVGLLRLVRPGAVTRLRAERARLIEEMEALKSRYVQMRELAEGGNRGAGI